MDGQAKEGQVLALYPGVVYFPGDPMFFPSIRNNFFLRRNDGISIDGKPYGLSKSVYKSSGFLVVGRDGKPLCDMSWLLAANRDAPRKKSR